LLKTSGNVERRMVAIVTLDGASIGLDAASVGKLRDRLKGGVILAGDPGYDEARRIWNGNIDRRPALIARCTDASDVRHAVGFAARYRLLLSVKGGAHSAPGYATNDGGMIIDLSRMKAVSVDPAKRRARCQGGTLWGELDTAAQEHGLAVTGGTVSNTGVAGLTLGGGMGWLMGKHGATVDNLIAVEIVTADGELRRASATGHPDLFWGVRGGGGNFGVVTSFEFQLHPVGEVLGGLVLHPLDRGTDLLKFYRDFCTGLPDEAEANAGLLTSPTGVPVAAMLLGYNGPVDEGERILAPARQWGRPIADMVKAQPYATRQTILDTPHAEHGHHRYWRSAFTEHISDELIAALMDGARRFTSPMSLLLLFYVHGAITRVPSDAMAFGARKAQWDFNAVGQWRDGSSTARHIDWVRSTWAATEPHVKGSVYINHIAEDDKPEKIRASYGENYTRLRAIKAKYDPANLFRMNSNIPPS
jgi:hypothetical protein